MKSDFSFDELRTFATADEEARGRRVSSVEILDYRPNDDRLPRLAAPGSITVFIGRRGDDRLNQLREIVAGGHDDGTLAASLMDQHDSRRPQAPAEIMEVLRRAGVYATLRCGARYLAAHICLPESGDLAVIPSAYNGGQLPANELTVIEHLLDGTEEEFEAVALKADPMLTAVEAAAVAQVGIDQIELNIAPNEGCAESMTAYAILILIALAIMPVENPVEHLNESVIDELGPEKSARQLMALRQQAIRLQR